MNDVRNIHSFPFVCVCLCARLSACIGPPKPNQYPGKRKFNLNPAGRADGPEFGGVCCTKYKNNTSIWDEFME